MIDKQHYDAKYLCPFIVKNFDQTNSPYECMIECRDFLYAMTDMIDHNLALLKLSNKSEQLILFLDRDYFFLNWRKYNGSELEFERTIAYWQICRMFQNMNQVEFESWLLKKLDEAKALEKTKGSRVRSSGIS